MEGEVGGIGRAVVLISVEVEVEVEVKVERLRLRLRGCFTSFAITIALIKGSGINILQSF